MTTRVALDAVLTATAGLDTLGAMQVLLTALLVKVGESADPDAMLAHVLDYLRTAKVRKP
jgi:hypothetical protein